MINEGHHKKAGVDRVGARGELHEDAPGCLADGSPILGYEEVTLDHIAALAQALWGERTEFFQQMVTPDTRHYTGPEGRWREREDKKLYGEPHWYMQRINETGRRVSTQDSHERRMFEE